MVERAKEIFGQEENDEFENSGVDVEAEKEVTVSGDKSVATRSADENSSEEDESWLVRVGDDSEPIELTKSEYRKLRPTR